MFFLLYLPVFVTYGGDQACVCVYVYLCMCVCVYAINCHTVVLALIVWDDPRTGSILVKLG